MKYRFKADIKASAGKLSREEKSEIRDYIGSLSLEAATPEKAVKALIKRISGRLISGQNESAEISLPDYGSACKVKVTAYEEN